MKLLNKIGLTFFIVTSILLCAYLCIPIKLGAVSNMFSEEPKNINISEVNKTNHGELKYTNYDIKDKNELENFYNELKEVKVLKILKKQETSNLYKVCMGEEYIEILLNDNFIRINNEDFVVLEPKDNYNKLIIEIKNNFIK